VPEHFAGPIPVFYINLASRPDRREHMERQFALLGVAAERIEAVTPATSDPKWVARAEGKVWSTELACTLSHHAIWSLMIERGLDAALVLEDDMLLAPALAALVARWNRDDVDLLRLETRRRRVMLGRAIDLSGGLTARQMLSHEAGTGAYLITRDLAARIIDDPRLARFPIDKFLFGRDGPCLRRDRLFVSCPALALPLDLTSAAGKQANRSDIRPERAARGATRRRSRTLGAKLGRMAANFLHAGLEIAHAARKGALLSLTRSRVPFADMGEE
jgi:GR25 family glycosyltransferase involved in LPS biosynthesis